GVAGDARGEVGRQRQRLVQRIGVQRLRAALRRRHRLDAGAGDIVEHVLGGKRPAGGLAMGAQRQRTGVARVELPHQLRPDRSRQTARAARSFATSMKKFMPMPKKKDSRGAKRSTSSWAARPARTYSTPSASV